jgi:hypothetical protein
VGIKRGDTITMLKAHKKGRKRINAVIDLVKIR